MLAEEIPVGDQLRTLMFELHAVLKQPAGNAEVVRSLMFRASTLKAQSRREPSNPLTRYLAAVQKLIGRAYGASPSAEFTSAPPPAERHAA